MRGFCDLCGRRAFILSKYCRTCRLNNPKPVKLPPIQKRKGRKW